LVEWKVEIKGNKSAGRQLGFGLAFNENFK
jgi:hypothetical protein